MAKAKKRAVAKVIGTQRAKPMPAKESAPVVLADDAQKAFERFLPIAAHLPKNELVSSRGADIQLALHNVRTAVDNLLGEHERISQQLPTVNLADLATLVEIALAVRWAAVEAARPQDTGKDVLEKLSAAHALRATLLAIAEGLAAADLVPRAEVKAIRAGRGPLDAAADCVALADLFTRYEKKIAGKHAATAKMLAGAREVGTYLLQTLKPARGKAGARANEAQIEVRDRLWSLLVKRYELARRTGYWLWGDGFSARVPPLLAHARAPKVKANGAPAPAPPVG